MRDFEYLAEAFEEEFGRKLPTEKEVCGRCRGEGTHWHSAFDNGITQSELAEWDDDEREGLFSGRYDVVCEECNGRNVIDVIDHSYLSPEQSKWVRDYKNEIAESYAIQEMERRMGA